ncbi:GntR family transcriptional regulator [Paracoccus cavernae]|uniref:GntR family transcriptional regulator n=1 Tax=Paracoccus cavernae TaxID=1571207 RepID=A0ABT8DA13_9RHOB|nr:GntR family transcriptional regulator [Paracoccus cavernae]
MFTLDAHSIDKNLPVPVGTQLHGLLSYMLAFGGFAYGERLPSVRKLAADLGIAPMTVVQVYHQLRDSGLIEMRQGSGAYAARPPVIEGSKPSAMALLHEDIARLLQRAAEINLSTMALVSMINAQSAMQLSHRALKIAFICIFPEAGSDYVRQIQPYLAPGDDVTLLTFDEISQPGPALQACRDADLILTFAHREADARRLTQSEQVLGLRLIPSQKTRQELAGLDPRAKVLGVTYLKDYIAIMRPSIREFAPCQRDQRHLVLVRDAGRRYRRKRCRDLCDRRRSYRGDGAPLDPMFRVPPCARSRRAGYDPRAETGPDPAGSA